LEEDRKDLPFPQIPSWNKKKVDAGTSIDVVSGRSPSLRPFRSRCSYPSSEDGRKRRIAGQEEMREVKIKNKEKDSFPLFIFFFFFFLSGVICNLSKFQAECVREY
jgi:hypothetical protein